MKKKLIAGNWKLNPTTKTEAIKLAENIKNNTKNFNFEVALCVPSIYLDTINEIIKDSPIKLGAQNCYFEEKGAFTGEISAQMLKDLNCKYVILGHSERRSLFAETDEIINHKIKIAMKNTLIPILCVGESEEQRNKNITDSIIEAQLTADLKDISIDGNNLVIAYEPIWAIGTGKTCSSEEADRVCGLIRNKIAQLYSKDIASKITIQYGGSVKSSTIKEQMKMENIDGALVGGASLIAEEFNLLLQNANN